MKNLKMKTSRLLLRPLSLEEMERILYGSQEFLELSVLTPVITDAVAHKIKQMRLTPVEAHPWLNYWLRKEKTSGRGIGLIGSKFLPDSSGYVELGYAVAEEYRNRGYMTEALNGFLDWLYQFPFCYGAKLSISEKNIASVKAAEHCGFCYQSAQNGFDIYRYQFLRNPVNSC